MFRVANQAEMEAAMKEFCRHIRCDFPGTVNEAISPQFVRCDYSSDSYTVAYQTTDFMRNPGGILHGGLISSMLDTAMGGLTYVCAGEKPTPTITMSVSYIRPATVGDLLHVDAALSRAGRTVSYVTARMYPANDPERTLATASGSYFSAI